MKLLLVLAFVGACYLVLMYLRRRAQRLDLKDPPVLNPMAEWPWKERK
jgi:hypothetical protein